MASEPKKPAQPGRPARTGGAKPSDVFKERGYRPPPARPDQSPKK